MAKKAAEKLTDRQMLLRVKEWKKNEALLKEIKARQETLKAEMSGSLEIQGEESKQVGDSTVYWQTVASNHLDTTALKKDLPDVYVKYFKVGTTKKFRVA